MDSIDERISDDLIPDKEAHNEIHPQEKSDNDHAVIEEVLSILEQSESDDSSNSDTHRRESDTEPKYELDAIHADGNRDRSAKREQLFDFLSKKNSCSSMGSNTCTREERSTEDALEEELKAFIRLSDENEARKEFESAPIENRVKGDHIRVFEDPQMQREMSNLLNELEMSKKTDVQKHFKMNESDIDKDFERRNELATSPRSLKRAKANFITRNKKWNEKRSVHKRELSVAAVQAEASECTFTPVLNNRSVLIAKERCDEGASVFVKSKLRSTAEMRYHDSLLQKEEEFEKNCTFKPMLNKRSIELVKRSKSRMISFRPAKREHQRDVHSERKNCTFKPSVHKISKSMQRAFEYCSEDPFKRLYCPAQESPFARRNAWAEKRAAEEKERCQESRNDDVEFDEFLQRQERKLSEKLDRIEAKKQSLESVEPVRLTKGSERISRRVQMTFLERQEMLLKKRSESVQSVRMEMEQSLLSKPKVNALSKRLAESSKYRMKTTLEAKDKRPGTNRFHQRQRSKISNRAHRADVSHAKSKLELKLEQERLRKEKEERAAAKKRREKKVPLDVFFERQRHYNEWKEERVVANRWKYRDREEEEVIAMMREKERMQKRRSNYFLRRIAIGELRSRLLHASSTTALMQLRSPTLSPDWRKCSRSQQDPLEFSLVDSYTQESNESLSHVVYTADAPAESDTHGTVTDPIEFMNERSGERENVILEEKVDKAAIDRDIDSSKDQGGDVLFDYMQDQKATEDGSETVVDTTIEDRWAIEKMEEMISIELRNQQKTPNAVESNWMNHSKADDTNVQEESYDFENGFGSTEGETIQKGSSKTLLEEDSLNIIQAQPQKLQPDQNKLSALSAASESTATIKEISKKNMEVNDISAEVQVCENRVAPTDVMDNSVESFEKMLQKERLDTISDSDRLQKNKDIQRNPLSPRYQSIQESLEIEPAVFKAPDAPKDGVNQQLLTDIMADPLEPIETLQKEILETISAPNQLQTESDQQQNPGSSVFQSIEESLKIEPAVFKVPDTTKACANHQVLTDIMADPLEPAVETFLQKEILDIIDDSARQNSHEYRRSISKSIRVNSVETVSKANTSPISDELQNISNIANPTDYAKQSLKKFNSNSVLDKADPINLIENFLRIEILNLFDEDEASMQSQKGK